MINPRAIAAQIIARVLRGASLTDAFAEGLPNTIESLDRGFIQELCYGVIRWYDPLRKICSYLLKKPLSTNDQDIYALLLIGLYQFMYLKTAAHAAVHETVQAAKDLKKNWAAPLINGVLRSFQRQQAGLLKKLSNEETQAAHPRWLMRKLQQAWPNDWLAIVKANNQTPPMSLRVNSLRISRDDYLQKLNANEINATLSPISDVGIILNETRSVYGLPNFSEGDVSIQDTAAQLATSLLMLEPKQTVLDACAAPGGKFAHILEAQPDLQSAVALDQDKTRLIKIEENLSRLKLMRPSVKLVCAKAQAFATNWQADKFDRILLDAPCSGTGVIRRHPDIKILRREDDISKLVHQQLELLVSLWSILKPGGILVYATCSILPEENQGVLQTFLGQQPDAQEKVIDANWGVPCKIGRQIFPQIHGTDGFYYARLYKKPD